MPIRSHGLQLRSTNCWKPRTLRAGDESELKMVRTNLSHDIRMAKHHHLKKISTCFNNTRDGKVSSPSQTTIFHQVPPQQTLMPPSQIQSAPMYSLKHYTLCQWGKLPLPRTARCISWINICSHITRTIIYTLSSKAGMSKIWPDGSGIPK